MKKYVPLVGGCIVDFPTELEKIEDVPVRRWVEHHLPPAGGLNVVPVLPKKVQDYFEGSAEGMLTGGGPGNVGRRLAGLAVPVRIHGYVGNDKWGNFYRQTMEGYGVDVSRIKVDPRQSTSVTVVVNFRAGNELERSFIHVLGSNLNDQSQLYQPDRYEAEIGYYGYLYITGNWPKSASDMGNVLQRMKESGKTAVLATTADPRRSWDGAEPALRNADIFLANDLEARGISRKTDTRKMAQYFHDLGVPIVSITNGANGCAISRGDEFYQKPAHNAPEKDVLAAGDSYAAGLMYALLGQLEIPDDFGKVDIDFMLDYGNAMGALAVVGYPRITAAMAEKVLSAPEGTWPDLSGLV